MMPSPRRIALMWIAWFAACAVVGGLSGAAGVLIARKVHR